MKNIFLTLLAGALLSVVAGACSNGAGPAATDVTTPPFTGPALVLFLTDN